MEYSFKGNTDIEQLYKIFQQLGTPTEQSWPNWEMLPDAGKVLFDPIDPIKDWAKLGENSIINGKKVFFTI